VISRNATRADDRRAVALATVDLVARRSLIQHPVRDCWITGTTSFVNSRATDPSCSRVG
jgi:hypothetical protein